jgi:hypothetical protein
MKIRFTYIVVALFLAFVIMFSTSCSSNFIPFSNDKMGFPYEGFSNNKKDLVTNKKESMAALSPSEVSLKKVEGFEGLLPAPYADTALIDPFFKAESRQDCQGSGLTKGSGSLCLTPELKTLLQTRGKNATGGDFQIGN